MATRSDAWNGRLNEFLDLVMRSGYDNIGAAHDPVTKELFAFVAEALKR